MFEHILAVISNWAATLVVVIGTALFGGTTHTAIAPVPHAPPPTASSSISLPTSTPLSTRIVPTSTIPVVLSPVTSTTSIRKIPVKPQQTVLPKTPPVSIPTPSNRTPPPLVVVPPPAKETVVRTPTPPGIPRDNGGALTPADIFTLTNIERSKQGLSKLTYNNTLAEIAEAKAADMIKQQYFEHTSPQGIDVTGLAKKYGYDYSHIGENLALGDFASSSHVVNGWMDSPGHRANILNVRYTEIGIAAVLGMWEGREVWFAVQEFGTPLPDCSKPDSLLHSKIDVLQTQIDAMESTLANLKQEIDSRVGTPEEQVQRVDDYNRIVAGYNGLIATERGLIADYNTQVKSYNACLESV